MLALVIDDSRVVRMIVGQILREIGIEVIEAGNGLEALEQMKGNPDVELLLVDWNMPHMNGFDFIRAIWSSTAIRAHPGGDVEARAAVNRVAASARRQRMRRGSPWQKSWWPN